MPVPAFNEGEAVTVVLDDARMVAVLVHVGPVVATVDTGHGRAMVTVAELAQWNPDPFTLTAAARNGKPEPFVRGRDRQERHVIEILAAHTLTDANACRCGTTPLALSLTAHRAHLASMLSPYPGAV